MVYGFILPFDQKMFLEGKSRIKLFFLSVFTSPIVSYVGAVILSCILVWILSPGYAQNIASRGALTETETVIFSCIIAVFYLMLNLLYAWLTGKWLGATSKQAVIFLYMMFNTIAVITNRSSGTGMLFSVPHLREIVDVIGTVQLFFEAWIFYRLDVKGLALMARERVKVNWKTFNIPPAIFASLYSVFVSVLTINDAMIEEKMIIVLYIFSGIINWLFIWAFYVITKNIRMTNEAIKAKEQVKTLSVEVMEALAHTIDAKDEYTRGHSVRVAKYSKMIAEKMGLSPEECESIYYMGLLHDIGKIGVPNAIINSTSRLTDEEYAVIKTHPGVGYDILAEIKSRPDLSIGARWHHERYDGRGYPDGKAGEEIPFLARIIAVADSYDAMTSNRSYRKYMPQDAVRSEIEKNMGMQFDPAVAKCMLAIIDEDVNYELHE